ncbi:MAG: metal ABC transporter ATP-binding protein [Gammaproteobacteria bacterium]
MSEIQITFEEVTFSYGGSPVLEGVNLEIRAGEFLGVVGPNAGGKTTLLKLMLGLLKPSSGTITVLGKTAAKGRQLIGYCPQHVTFARDFPLCVEEAVMLGRLGRTQPLGGYRNEDRGIVEQALAATELLPIRKRRLETLSGGQLQRVLVGRALASQPEVVVLDEPTANIDLRMEEDIFDLLKRLNRRLTIVVVSHDIGFISGYVTRVACLNRTLFCHYPSELTGDAIERLYRGHVSLIEHLH